MGSRLSVALRVRKMLPLFVLVVLLIDSSLSQPIQENSNQIRNNNEITHRCGQTLKVRILKLCNYEVLTTNDGFPNLNYHKGIASDCCHRECENEYIIENYCKYPYATTTTSPISEPQDIVRKTGTRRHLDNQVGKKMGNHEKGRNHRKRFIMQCMYADRPRFRRRDRRRLKPETKIRKQKSIIHNIIHSRECLDCGPPEIRTN